MTSRHEPTRLLLCLLLVAVATIPAHAERGRRGAPGPSLERQLAEAHAAPGSRLARMIRDNQEFWLLSPAELGAAVGDEDLPLWFRVAWRKAHPKWDPRAVSADYPFVVHDAYEMLVGRSESEAHEPGGAAPPQKVIVLLDLPMSSLPTTRLRESEVEINPWNPAQILGAANDPGNGKQAMFRSSDYGLTWKQSSLPFTSNDEAHTDPTVDWTSDGTAWSTTLGIKLPEFELRGRVYKSTDAGKTWKFDSTFSGTQTSVDKQMVVVDHGDTSPRKDWTYAVWRELDTDRIFFNRRPIGGNWGTPKQLSGAETSGAATGAEIETDRFGFVYAFWTSQGNKKIFLRRSLDGGASWDAPIEVAGTFATHKFGVPAIAKRKALIYVTAAADTTTANAYVYAAWADLSGTLGCTSDANAPGTAWFSSCTSKIWFARSTDFGTTWAPAVKINDQPDPNILNDQFHPALAVDPLSGIVSVTYHDSIGDEGRVQTNVWYQASYDRGVTWTKPVKVSSAFTDETTWKAGDSQYGDYNGLSAWNRILTPSWTDRRNDAPAEAIWTAALEEPRADVWMKDKPWDTGAEPDPATAADPMWESEDIWVRNDQTPGAHQNPIYGQTNYVHVAVRNRSFAKAENVPVRLYWAKSSAGLGWASDWTEIGLATVPTVPGNADTEVVVPWDPPGKGHYCLLARIVTTQDVFHSAETFDVDSNTRQNNNIAWKNVVVVSLFKWPQAIVDLVLRNSTDQATLVKVGFEDRLERGVERPFLRRGRLTLSTDPELVRRWREGGSGGHGVRLLDERTWEIVEAGAEIAVPMERGEAFQSELAFEDLERNGGERTERHVVAVTETAAEGQTPFGGVTYTVEAPVR